MIKTLYSTVSISALLMGSVAMAQTAPGPSNGTVDSPSVDQSGIEDIIVTAQKRSENLQSIPATITAVSADTLKRQGVNEVTDLTRVAPEVTVSQGSFQNVAIRGIRTGAFSPTTESPNAVHVDGIYLARFTALRGLFFDIDRIEVLAGPQGTLYGRNSAGGTVNIITTRPKAELGGQGSLEFGNYGTIIASSAINVPVTDTLAVRAAAFVNYNQGYNSNGTDDIDTKSFRISARWVPTSRDTLLLTGDDEIIGGKGPSAGAITQVYKNPSVATNPVTGGVSLVAAGTPGSVVVPYVTGGPRDSRLVFGDQQFSRRNVKSAGFMAQYDHDFDWATLTAQVGYRDNFQHDRGGSIIPQDPRLITSGATASVQGGGGFAPAPTFLDSSDRTNSQELRLASAPSSKTFKWLVGLYRFEEHGYDINNGTYLVQYPNGTGTIGQVVVSNPLVIGTDIGNTSNRATAYAAFGQATYTPEGFDRLHLTAGVRYNTEHKHGIGFNITNGAFTNNFDLQDTYRATTYKLNAAFDITDSALIYFDHSTGFKSGGFGYGAKPAFQPERIKAYEAGFKSRFFDNHLQLNASAWHYDYTNYVTTVPIFFVDLTGPFPRIAAQINSTNAASAKIDGQSVMADLILSDHDRFSFDVIHLHTKFESFDISAGYAGLIAGGFNPGATAATFNYSGTPIGGAADFAGNATYDHSFDLGDGVLDFQGAVHYIGRRLLGNQASVADINSYYVASPYATVDTSLRYEMHGGKWSVTLYGRNLTDNGQLQTRTYVSNAAFLPASDPRVRYAYEIKTLGTPRTFGAIFAARF